VEDRCPSSGKSREIHGKIPYNHSRPSVGQVAIIENHRHLTPSGNRESRGQMFRHFEFAIRETPMSGGHCHHSRGGGQRRSGGQLSANRESGYRDFRGHRMLA
jgi:hypothetical protein